jgi:hypothetical protein
MASNKHLQQSMPPVSLSKSPSKTANSLHLKLVENPPAPALLELQKHYQDLEAEYEKLAAAALSQLAHVESLMQGQNSPKSASTDLAYGGSSGNSSSQRKERKQQNRTRDKHNRELFEPAIAVKKLPPDPNTPLNQDWVMKNRVKYRGKWVALRAGKLLDSDRSLDKLLTRISNDKDIFLTVVY